MLKEDSNLVEVMGSGGFEEILLPRFSGFIFSDLFQA